MALHTLTIVLSAGKAVFFTLVADIERAALGLLIFLRSFVLSGLLDVLR